jgi:hypothetical protein
MDSPESINKALNRQQISLYGSSYSEPNFRFKSQDVEIVKIELNISQVE